MTSQTAKSSGFTSFRFRNSSDESENTVFQYLRRLNDNVKHLFGTFFIFLFFFTRRERDAREFYRGYVELSSYF